MDFFTFLNQSGAGLFIMKKNYLLLSLLVFTLNLSAQSGKTIKLDKYTTLYVNDTISVIMSKKSKYGVATNDGKLLVPVEYDDILQRVLTDYDYGKELFFLVSKNDKWGIASNRKVYVEPEFDNFVSQAEKLLSFIKDGKQGVVTLKGRVVLPAEYDVVNFYPQSWSSFIIAAFKDGQWTIFNDYNLDLVDVDFPIDALESTECLVTLEDEQYILASAFYNGFARVCKNDHYGMVNPQGKIIVPAEFDDVSALGDRLFVVGKDEKYGLFRNDGKQLAPCSFDLSMGFGPDSLYVLMSKGDHLYEIDFDGNVRKQASVEDLKDKYTWVLDCYNGQAIVYIDREPCVMAYDGTVIIPRKYRHIESANNSGAFGLTFDKKSYYKVANDNGLFAAFDEKGVKLTDFKYADLHYVGGNKEAFVVATVEDDKVKCGVCDSTGREIIPLEYESFRTCAGDVFALSRNGKYGVVNTDNKTVIPFELDSVTTVISLVGLDFENMCHMIAASKAGKWALINGDGKKLTDFELDSVSTDFGIRESPMIAIKKGNKWALMDREGNQLTDFAFDLIGRSLMSQSATLIEDYSEGMGKAMSDSGYGYFDSKGNLVIPCVYKYGQEFSCGLAAVEKERYQYGYIDKKGNVVIPFIYENASSFDPKTKTARAKLNDQRVTINMKGEVVAGD